MTRIALVVAMDRHGVIGRNGGLPWHISSELKRFKTITMGKPVIMGRKTWESLPRKPLPGRTNIIVTRTGALPVPAGVLVARDADEALAIARREDSDEIAVIGGGEIYRIFLPLAARLYLTEVDLSVAGDTHFPAIAEVDWTEIARETHAPGPGDSAGYTLRVLDRVQGATREP